MGLKVTKEYYFNNAYPEPNTGCWIYGGQIHPVTGYGCGSLILDDGYRLCGSHRVSYYLFKGSFDRSLYVCHACDNRWCINPDHLFLGTLQDNLKDMENKGRVSHGEKHFGSKLSEESVKKIRTKYNDGNHTYYSLAKEYGVDHSTIYAVVKYKLWKHVR